MKYENLFSVNKPVSRLVYGTNACMSGSDPEAAVDCLDAAWANGFTIFDTANSYGQSEKNIGVWMQRRGLRDRVVLLDKGCNPGQKGSPDVMCAQLLYDQTAESCRRLQTDYLDLYVLHRDDPSYPVAPIIDALNDLKAKGVIRHFGASNWTRARVAEANSYAQSQRMEGFSVVSPAFSIAETVGDPWGGSVNLCGAAHRADREWYKEQGIPVFSYSSLGRGFFSGKFKTTGNIPAEECLPSYVLAEYDSPVNRRRLAAAEKIAAEHGATVSQVCIAWLLALPLEVFPIINPSRVSHMQENIAGLELKLSSEEIRLLSEDV